MTLSDLLHSLIHPVTLSEALALVGLWLMASLVVGALVSRVIDWLMLERE